MKIVQDGMSTLMCFGNLSPGDTYVLPRGSAVYLKVTAKYVHGSCGLHNDDAFAVALSSGYLYGPIDKNREVIKVNVVATVRGSGPE